MRNNLKIIIILCLISSLARFVLDSYLPSLPGISQSFGISDTSTQITLTLYLLGFSISQLIYGPLSDHYGRRPVLLIGLSIFFVGNLICSFASSANLLLLARFVAGIGAGSCGTLNRAIASDCYKGAEFSKAWSYTTTTLVITLCVAPVLGGYIQEIFGWRANFMLSSLFVGGVLLSIIKFLPETNKHTMKTQHTKINMTEILKNYKTILTTPTFITGVLCYTLAFSGLIAYFQVSPLLFINELDFSPKEYGWCSLVIATNYFLGGLIVNKFAHRIGTQWMLVLGSVLLIIGGGFMWCEYLTDEMELSTILPPAAIYVIGARIVIPNAIACSMEKLRHLNGSTSALIGFIQMLGSSLMSLLISLCDNSSSLPLAVFLTAIGCLTASSALISVKDKIRLAAIF